MKHFHGTEYAILGTALVLVFLVFAALVGVLLV